MHFFNRCQAAVLAAVLCLSAVFSTSVRAAEVSDAVSDNPYEKTIESNAWENWPAGPQVYAESAIVMEASTGTILYSKDIDKQLYPASITKIMTVLLAIENLDMDEEITFSHNAVYSIEAGSSSISRDEGEILTVEECLYAIMLESANECANAIAERISGTTEAFAELMNERAAELGCTNTHFVNPHGLPDENHYTSAHDMALITQAAISYEKFRQISGTARYTLRATNKKSEELYMSNHHYMISGNRTTKYVDDTVFAGKTGYTSAALNTLVTCATRSGMDLIVVTMRTQGTGEAGVPIYPDTINLLDYAGEHFHKVNISQNETDFSLGQGELFDTGSSVFGTSQAMIEMDQSGCVILPVDADFSDASAKLTFTDSSDSDVIATLSYTYAGQAVGSTKLLLTENEVQGFEFQESGEDAAAEETQEEVRLIRIDLRIVGLAACILLSLLLLIFLLRKISRDYAFDFHPLRRLREGRAERGSFADRRRRRYRSWKRRFRSKKR